MNEHFPPEYVAQIGWMSELLKTAAAWGPSFVMPPKSILFAAALSDVPRIACNDAARMLLEAFCTSSPCPTVFGLRCALELAGIECRFLPFSAFLEHVGISGDKVHLLGRGTGAGGAS